jgi:penicillin-binding protein 1C
MALSLVGRPLLADRSRIRARAHDIDGLVAQLGGSWGVRIGNFDGSPMPDVSGVTGAAPVWLEIMSYLHRGRPVQPPRLPAGVVTADVHFTPAVEPARREYYLAGTESMDVRLPDRTDRQVARIAYPGRGAILALDPDIPAGHERVFFEIAPASDDYVVRIDDTLVSAHSGWQPVPGRHRAALLDRHGAVLDQTEFEVRGAPLRSASGDAN